MGTMIIFYASEHDFNTFLLGILMVSLFVSGLHNKTSHWVIGIVRMVIMPLSVEMMSTVIYMNGRWCLLSVGGFEFNM